MNSASACSKYRQHMVSVQGNAWAGRAAQARRNDNRRCQRRACIKRNLYSSDYRPARVLPIGKIRVYKT